MPVLKNRINNCALLEYLKQTHRYTKPRGARYTEKDVIQNNRSMLKN